MDPPKNSKWFHERLGPSEGHVHEVKTVLFSKQTPFQLIEVVELGDYGRSLILDGKVQSTQTDEFIYHEVLVHPAMLVHPDPKRVMVIGGGEGATLREVLRHRSVERALMVDIDREVVEVSRAMLPEFHAGAFDDPRTELAFEDARRWLETHDQVFDVIIIDLSDPIEEGPCYRLYTREFYRLVNRRLSPQGTIALQSGSVAPHDLLNFSAIYRTLLTAFPVVCPYVANVPCFGLPWGFQMASKEVNPRAYSAADYDKMIARRIQGELKYLTGEVCAAQMALPKHLQARLASETLVIEDEVKVASFIQRALEEESYAVDVCADGAKGLELAGTACYDLVILDLMLPGLPGLEVLKMLRKDQVSVPLLILTAQSQVNQKVKGLDAGADDYLTKPFAIEELLARVRVLLRRGSGEAAGLLQVDDLVLNPATRGVTRGGGRIELTAKEYALLEYLMRNVGRVLTRPMIAEHVWNQDFDTFTNVIDVYVNYLRNKIDRGQDRKLIHTIRGSGYVLKAE